MATHLETLLQRVQDGSATDAELGELRAAVDGMEWSVPVADALQSEAGSVDVVAGVLEALGMESHPVGAAVLDEAGRVDIAASVLAELALDGVVPIGEAVRAEAGPFEGAPAILESLGLDQGASVADAIHAKAGQIDLSAAVLAELDAASMPLSEALRYEAGAVDVTDAVMAAIDAEQMPVAEAVRLEAGEIDVSGAVMAALATADAMPDSVASAPSMPAPANNNRRWLVAMLAAAMVFLVLGAAGLTGALGLVGISTMSGGDGGAGPGGSAVQVAGFDGAGERLFEPAAELMFASSSEVQIVDLTFGDDVVVFQDEGDDGALILWVDDEEVL